MNGLTEVDVHPFKDSAHVQTLVSKRAWPGVNRGLYYFNALTTFPQTRSFCVFLRKKRRVYSSVNDMGECGLRYFSPSHS